MSQDSALLNIPRIHTVSRAQHSEAPDVMVSALFTYSNSKA